MKEKYLENIQRPSDLKLLSVEQLDKLCEEIRAKLINTVSNNGGHLSPNLGAVELTVALERSFCGKHDDIVWDVGHQCYTHKLLTGRQKDFDTIRTEGGISGFPKREESDYDAFNVGHSSTSISAAYGIARAKELKKQFGYTVAVIGDGALTGGLAFEGLNNAGRSKKNIIVVLNDNEMSISKNVGGIAKYLTNMRINSGYLRLKRYIEKVLMHVPLIGKPIRSALLKSKNSMRKRLYHDTIFDDLGFLYYGPVDGHDIQKMLNAFKAAKRTDTPVLVHVMTTKGKGYVHAENDPGSFHGISKFDIDTGEPISAKVGYSAVFGEYLCELAQKDNKICAITAAMASGTGLKQFSDMYKNRFFDVGIAEEHAVTFSAGLASKGILPVFSVYSSFLQRAYDQILHDAAAQKLHIVLAVDRAGIVGEDGETHQGVFDVAFLSTIPNVTIYAPSSFNELRIYLRKAIYDTENVAVVRYPRGGEDYIPDSYTSSDEDYSVYNSGKTAIVTYGRLFSNACRAADRLKEDGIDVAVIKLNKIKPIVTSAVEECLKYDNIFFYEEGMRTGGVGEHLFMKLNHENYNGKFHLTAIDDKFVKQATVSSALRKLGLDTDSMISDIKRIIDL
ncbi:MAG: 1-deoxy-D-xylulose-5-phosphate synthase [Clostridia bacterium]|nr:1-deoxy-D-xylulose-5-phosphate synthase [Clostridia bacterium]